MLSSFSLSKLIDFNLFNDSSSEILVSLNLSILFDDIFVLYLLSPVYVANIGFSLRVFSHSVFKKELNFLFSSSLFDVLC